MKKNRCQILCFMCICWIRQYNNLQLRCNIDVKHAEISRSVTTHASSQEVSPRLYNTKPNPDIKWSDQIVKSEYSKVSVRCFYPINFVVYWVFCNFLRIPSVSLKATKWGGVSESPYKTGGPVVTLKNPAKCLWRLEPDRRCYFFSPPAHMCR